jgi:predicted PurR-regulated permease PerM
MPFHVRPFPFERFSAAITLQRMLAVGLALLLLWLLGQVVLLVFAAVLLAVLLSAPARWISEHGGIGYGWCLALVIALILLALTGIGIALAPEVDRQIGQLSTQLPPALHHLIGGVEASSIGGALLGQLHAGGEAGGGSLAAPLLKSASSLVEAVGSIVFVAFVGLYLAATPHAYERGLLRLIPAERCARARDIIAAIGTTLKLFLYGRLFSMGVIAILSMAGLWVLGVPAPIALGLLAGALSFVPYVGSAASGLAPFVLAYVGEPVSGLYVIILYVGIHALDGYILVPLVQRRMVHLLPAVTLTAQLVLGILWGLLGIAVATPMAAALTTLVEMGYVEDVLGKRREPLAPGPRRGILGQSPAPAASRPENDRPA